MPTYDYQCKECGNIFEEFQSMSAEFLVDCPSCGKPSLVRLFASGAGMIFKGSGFYLTDYKKSGGSAPSSSSKDSDQKDSSQKDSGQKDSGKKDSEQKETKPTAPPKPETPRNDS